MPHHHIIERILAHNKNQVREFNSDAAIAHRFRFRRDHKVCVIVIKCMDGRVHFAILTDMPLGIVHPFRNLGGVADVGMTTLNLRLKLIIEDARTQDEEILFVVTYHYAEGNHQRGCRAFGYDEDRARQNAIGIVRQVQRCLNGVVYPIMIGLETDRHSLHFHGNPNIDTCCDIGVMLGEHTTTTDMQSAVQTECARLYPSASERMSKLLCEFMIGNARHIVKTRPEGRIETDLEHRECVLAIGEGFDWMHILNFALIIGDFTPHLKAAIRAAVDLLEENFRRDQLPGGQAVLFVSVPYGEDYFRELITERARRLAQLAAQVVQSYNPEFAKRFHSLTAVVRRETRQLEILE